MPEQFYDYWRQWCLYHPDWQPCLWSDYLVSTIALVNQDLYDQAVVLAQKADILRFELIYIYGGIWLDTDVEVVQPLSPLLDNEFFTGYEDDNYLCPSVFGAVPEHPVSKALVEHLADNMHKHGFPAINDYRDCVGLEQSATRYFTREVKQFPDVTLYDRRYFYPYGWWEQDQAGRRFPETYTVHHWAASWKEKA